MPKYSPFKSGRFRVTSRYGERVLGGVPEFHAGVDLVDADPAGIITAIMGGKVVRSRIVSQSTGSRTWEWGHYVCVQQDDARLAYYAHLDERHVTEGQRVLAGAELGVMGNTGHSFGRHLHLEIREGAKAINAAEYLKIPNEVGAIVDMPTAPVIDKWAILQRKTGLEDHTIAYLQAWEWADALCDKLLKQMR